MECLSLLRAIQAVVARGIEQCTFLTDSQMLVHSLTHAQAPVCVQWQAYSETMSHKSL